MLSSISSIFTIVFAILFAALAWMLYSVVLRPIYLIRYYGKQGAAKEYFPIIGAYGKRIMESPKTGNFNETYRKILQEQNPDVPAFATNMGSEALIALVKPALIKEFLLRQEDYYVKAEALMDLYKCFVGDGLVTSEGEIWKKHRKIVSSVFHFDFIKGTVPIILETTREFLDKLKTKDLNNVDIMQELEKITAEVVGRVFFGQQFSKYTIRGEPFMEYVYKVGLPLVQEALGVYNHLIGPWFIKAGILPRHKKIMDGLREIREFARQVIEERRKQRAQNSEYRDKTNLLDLLLQTQENSNEGFLTTEEIIDEFLTFYIAGTDTTSHLLTLAVYNLTQNPEAYQKTLEESLIFKNKEDDKISYSDVEGMQFTLGVLKETLRLTNPALVVFMRRSLKDHQLSDFKIKKGTLVCYFTNHNCLKEEYFEDPNSFKPERWLPSSDVNAKWKKEPYSYTPFSAGPRNCIGQHLALLESRIIMGIFLTEFEMKVPENYTMKTTARFLLEPLDPLLLNLKLKTA